VSFFEIQFRCYSPNNAQKGEVMPLDGQQLQQQQQQQQQQVAVSPIQSKKKPRTGFSIGRNKSKSNGFKKKQKTSNFNSNCSNGRTIFAQTHLQTISEQNC
jgi:hypothetical protein